MTLQMKFSSPPTVIPSSASASGGGSAAPGGGSAATVLATLARVPIARCILATIAQPPALQSQVITGTQSVGFAVLPAVPTAATLDPVRHVLGATSTIAAAVGAASGGVFLLPKSDWFSPFLTTTPADRFRTGFGFYMRATVRRDIIVAGVHEVVMGLVDTNLLPNANGFQGFICDQASPNWRAVFRGAPVNGSILDVDLGVPAVEAHDLELLIGVTTGNTAFVSWSIDSTERQRLETAIGGVILADYGFATSGFWNNQPRVCVQKNAISGASASITQCIGAPTEWGYFYG